MKNIVFKLSAYVIVTFSSCTPRLGQIIKNNYVLGSDSISSRPTISNSIKHETEKLTINTLCDSNVILKPATQVGEFITVPCPRNKYSSFIYRSPYKPNIIPSKAIMPSITTPVKARQTYPPNQDNQLNYLTLGLLSLGLITFKVKKNYPKNHFKRNNYCNINKRRK